MENKFVTYKKLKIGQQIEGYKIGDLQRWFKAYIKSINPNFVTVTLWSKDGKEENISNEALFSVEMTEEEFREKYKEKAIEILKGLQNKLSSYEIGYHEMWNGWIDNDLYEMAANCVKENLKIIGYSTDIKPHTICSCIILDTGICVEDEDGEKFWCHTSKEMVERILDRNKNLLEETK